MFQTNFRKLRRKYFFGEKKSNFCWLELWLYVLLSCDGSTGKSTLSVIRRTPPILLLNPSQAIADHHHYQFGQIHLAILDKYIWRFRTNTLLQFETIRRKPPLLHLTSYQAIADHHRINLRKHEKKAKHEKKWAEEKTGKNLRKLLYCNYAKHRNAKIGLYSTRRKCWIDT